MGGLGFATSGFRVKVLEIRAFGFEKSFRLKALGKGSRGSEPKVSGRWLKVCKGLSLPTCGILGNRGIYNG